MTNDGTPLAVDEEPTTPVPVESMRDLVFGRETDSYIVDDRDELFPSWEE